MRSRRAIVVVTAVLLAAGAAWIFSSRVDKAAPGSADESSPSLPKNRIETTTRPGSRSTPRPNTAGGTATLETKSDARRVDSQPTANASPVVDSPILNFHRMPFSRLDEPGYPDELKAQYTSRIDQIAEKLQLTSAQRDRMMDQGLEVYQMIKVLNDYGDPSNPASAGQADYLRGIREQWTEKMKLPLTPEQRAQMEREHLEFFEVVR